jgi:hypothetical protein
LHANLAVGACGIRFALDLSEVFMRRFLLLASFSALVIGASGCATTLMPVSSHVQRGLDFARYRTYDWGPADAIPTGDRRLEQNAFFVDHVHGAIDRGLQARGLTRAVDVPADLLVHYHASVTERMEVVRIDQESRACVGADCRSVVEVYDAGFLIIDIVDARDKRVVWRGWAEHRLEDMLDRPDRVARRIDDAVARVLATLPMEELR